jgi:hypothetical protein
MPAAVDLRECGRRFMAGIPAVRQVALLHRASPAVAIFPTSIRELLALDDRRLVASLPIINHPIVFRFIGDGEPSPR